MLLVQVLMIQSKHRYISSGNLCGGGAGGGLFSLSLLLSLSLSLSSHRNNTAAQHATKKKTTRDWRLSPVPAQVSLVYHQSSLPQSVIPLILSLPLALTPAKS